eukprot:Rhum_TRINITY_DN7972_c0_g1::Rhum_TRINITY_DN7972_c0_g1_i1::g.25484::m.25484/K01230/MAN1; mannosyl-oligosaccharide alpha-1,2-mannosidase
MMSLRRNLAATLSAIGLCVLFLAAFLNARSTAFAEAAAGRRRAAEWDDRLLTLVTKVDARLQSLSTKVDTVATAQGSLEEKSAQLATAVARQERAEAERQEALAASGVKQTQAVKQQFDKLALDRQFDREMHGQEHVKDAEAQAAAHEKLERQLEALLTSLKQQRSAAAPPTPAPSPTPAAATPSPSETLQQRRRRRWRPNAVQLTSYSGAAGGGAGAGSASDSDAAEAEAAAPFRRDSVRQAIKRAWDAYAAHALGADELDSVTNEAKNWDDGNKQMVTLVDALDTLYVAGLRNEFDAAVSHLEKHFRFTPSASVSVFETTIRLTGGLLSAYALSNRTVLLEKAIEVADVLAPVYTKESLAANNGMPYHGYNPSRGEGLRGYGTFLAEAGSVQLENRYLSHASGNATYDERVSSFFGKFAEDAGDDGLVGNEWEATETRRWGGAQGTGARSDSYYEYLLKQHLLTETGGEGGEASAAAAAAAGGDGGFGELYVRAANGILSTLTKTYVDVKSRVRMSFSTSGVGLTASDGHTYYPPEQVAEHLSCFVPGMLALGSRHAAAGAMDAATRARHMAKAKEMTAFCAHQYLSSPTGLSGDAFVPEFAAPSRAEVEAGATPEGAAKVIRPNYGLRPETVESLFYMHRATRDAEHREAGWKIFQAIEKHCRVCADCEVSGYSEVADATVDKDTKVTHTGHMESFFLGETMKYLYLLFADDSVLDLDCWVFNTEAHPFPRLSKSLPAKCYRSPPSAMHEAGWSAAQT